MDHRVPHASLEPTGETGMCRRRSWQAILVITVLMATAVVSLAAPSRIERAWGKLAELSAKSAEAAEMAGKKALAATGMELGVWHCVGPFKHEFFGNIERSVAMVYPPEKDVLAAGADAAGLARTYEAAKLPGTLDTRRTWTHHPEWSDGYRHQLPRGPSPSRNETVYLYRTITVAKAVTVEMKVYAEDYIKAWVNGKLLGHVGRRGGPSRAPSSLRVQLPLVAGDNRLLVKISSIHAAHGFSFSLPGYTPDHPLTPLQWPAWLKSGVSRFGPGNQPYASADRTDEPIATPEWYVKKATWVETLTASQARLAAPKSVLPKPKRENPDGIITPWTPGTAAARSISVDVTGWDSLCLLTAAKGPGDGRLTIWADAKLIDAAGKITYVSSLKPFAARVGWGKVYHDCDQFGRPLRIGARQFKRGLWTCADSQVAFRLGGKYKRFDAWIGTDAQRRLGKARFQVLPVPGRKGTLIGSPAGRLWPLLARDFPEASDRAEMTREQRDGIWDGGAIAEAVLFDRYAGALAGKLAVPATEIAEHLPATKDAAGVAVVRELYHRASAQAESLARVRQFRFDVTQTPMYDPPTSKMAHSLDELPPSAGAKAYLDSLAAMKAKAAAGEALIAVGDGRGAAAIAAAAAAIDAMWVEQIRRLPPIAFIQCPAFTVNAIAPYTSGGASPASICVFDPARPKHRSRVVFHDPAMRIFDMNVSFDAKTIFFSARRGNESWHIYEVGVDGKRFRQITSGTSTNISPVLLPSGEIMFVSDRANTWVQCQTRKAGLLYVANRDGSNVRRVSANIDSDHTPQVMDDGRVLFTRWDYGVEKNVFARHALWTMNPDGTTFRLLFGNTIEDPAALWQGRPIPGRPEVVCTFGPHHSYQAGMVGMVWDRFGAEAPRGEGFRFVTDEIPAYCDTRFGHGYQDPFPVNERQFVVSYGGDGGRKNRLYLLDDRGNKKCIYEAGGNLGCWSPLLLAPRKTPPVIATQCNNPEWVYRDPVEANRNPDNLTGTMVLQDVYRGIEAHVRRGEAKSIQIMEQVQKSRCMVGGEAWGHTPIIGRGTVHVRRLVGTVPIESDGSAHFTAPALRNISLNVLDADGRVLMRMGSDMHIMPGEKRSCIGCHENRDRHMAPVDRQRPPIAARRNPSTPKLPAWGTDGLLDFPKVVQPVLDKYCVKCHGGPTPKGGVSLTGDKTRFFSMGYDNLVERGLVHFTNVFALDHDDTTPKTVGSIVSKIRPYIEDPKHCGKVIPLADRQRIYTWIDANVPYYGTYTYTKVRGIGARDSWGCGDRNGWLKKQVWPTFEKRCYDCHKRTVHNQALYGTAAARISSKIWTDRGVTAHGFPGRYPMSGLVGPELRINLTHPSHSLLLTAPLAKAAGGLGMCKDKSGRSFIFKDAADPDYQAMLKGIEEGRKALLAIPRVDMAPARLPVGKVE